MIGAPIVDLYRAGNGKREETETLGNGVDNISIEERCALAANIRAFSHVWWNALRDIIG